MGKDAMLPGFEDKKVIPIPVLQFTSKRQGQEANISGRLCEGAIEAAFRARGIHVVEYKDTRGGDLFEPRRLIKHAPFRSIFGARSRSEFVYEHGPHLAVRIECKVQNEPGSIDEKFPYLLMNALEAQPEPCIWFVIAGLGARTRAIKWLRNAVDNCRKKQLRLYSVEEAQRAVKRLVEQGIG